MKAPGQPYLLRILIWLDEGVNVLLGPLFNLVCRTNRWGYDGETISSVVGKLAKEGKALWAEAVINWIFALLTGEQNHCRSNIDPDEGTAVPASGEA